MKKKGIVIIVSILIVGLVGFNIWKNQATPNEKVEIATLEEDTMKETVMTPGVLKLDKEQYVFAQPEKGEIAEIVVEAGDKVSTGDDLIRYENKQLNLEKEQNDLQIRSSYLELDSIKKQHRDIDKLVEKDKDNEMLQEEHDQIKLQQQMANIELERLQLQKKSIEAELANLTVTAEVDGTILTVNEKAASESQVAEQSIIRIGSLSDVIVEGTISEYDTLNIAVDQQVILTSDAVPEEEWKGKVSFIADLPEESNGMGLDSGDTSVLYPIQVTVEEDIKLKPGFKMLIEIVTDEEKVNTLPINAVQQEDEVNYVFIVEAGKAKRVEIEIGSVDSEKMEVKDGVTKDDKVIINPSDNISSGTEVTVK